MLIIFILKNNNSKNMYHFHQRLDEIEGIMADVSKISIKSH